MKQKGIEKCKKKRTKSRPKPPKESLDETLFDKRTLELNLKQKRISQKEYQKFLMSLPDVSDNIEKEFE